MPEYVITTTIQSLDTTNPPTEVKWYRGRNLAAAMAAAVKAMADHADEDNNLPLSMQYRTLHVDTEIRYCVWETNQYQRWAQVECDGPVEETTRQDQTGLLCRAHAERWDDLAKGGYSRGSSPVPLTNLGRKTAGLTD